MKKRILLADDSITIQKVVELTFSEGDYEVVCVGNGALAQQQIAQAAPDIALLDGIMPERSGYEVCAAIKKDEALRWMPVLLLTGAFEPYDEGRARQAGADGHMTKPFESRTLVAHVERLLAAHPRPGMAATQTANEPAARRPEETARIEPSALFSQVPPGPAVATAAVAGQPPSGHMVDRPTREAGRAGPAPAPPSPRAPEPPAASSKESSVPPEILERAVREAVAGISERIVREVAWEVIPDLAEAIINRRIRELEDEAER